jgi:heme/copper-type cytochrome/quinol oxidase subunit 3
MTTFVADYFGTRTRRATWLLIAGNFLLFGALLGVMFYQRWLSEEWPAPFHFPSLLMAGAMTMFALCASVTMAVGAAAAKQIEDTEPAVRWIAIAIVCWMVFLFLEIVEWVRLIYLERLGPDTSFGWTFLMLTGTHALAAALCCGWFTRVATDVKRHDANAAALYSHFLNLWWLVLVVCLYLVNSDLEGM